MSQDNVRLALWISGVWGGLIILIVGTEAIVHDGAIATTIVDTFSKVLFGLGAILGTITGLGKLFDAHVAVNNASAAAAAVNAGSLLASDPGSPDVPDASAAVAGVGVD